MALPASLDAMLRRARAAMSTQSSMRNILIVHANIVVYAFAYWLTNPLLPYMLKEHGDTGIAFGALQSLFNAIQLAGGLVMGYLQDHYSGSVALSVTQLGAALVYVCLFAARSVLMLFLSRIPTVLQQSMQVAQAYVSKLSTSEDRAVALSRLSISYSAGMVLGAFASSGVVSFFGLHGTALVAALVNVSIVVVNAKFLDSLALATESQVRRRAGALPTEWRADGGDDELMKLDTDGGGRAVVPRSAAANRANTVVRPAVADGAASRGAAVVVVSPNGPAAAAAAVNSDGGDASSTSSATFVRHPSPAARDTRDVTPAYARADARPRRRRNAAGGHDGGAIGGALSSSGGHISGSIHHSHPHSHQQQLASSNRVGRLTPPSSQDSGRSSDDDGHDLDTRSGGGASSSSGGGGDDDALADVPEDEIGGKGIGSYAALALRLRILLGFMALLFVTRHMYEPVFILLLMNRFEVPAHQMGTVVAGFALLSAGANIVGTPALVKLLRSESRSISLLVVSGAVAYGLLAMLAPQNLWLFLFLNGVIAVCGSMLYTFSSSFVASRVPKEFHGRTIALVHSVRSATGIVGPIAGSVAYEYGGGETAAIACAIVLTAARFVLQWQ